MNELRVRLINGYEPQEGHSEEHRKGFYHQLDLEIKKPELAGYLVCIEMDSNAKLGPVIVPGDPHTQSENGKLLMNVVEANDLIVVNGKDVCKGIITRFRETVNGCEKSVIDHFIVCRRMFELINGMIVDEAGKHALTSYCNKAGKKTIVKESDHKTIILEVNIQWKSVLKESNDMKEVFNLKDKVSKCFDKLEYVNTANDFYSAGVTDDKFILVANSNKKCDVGIRTPWGGTANRLILNNIEMQGTVLLAPLKCSVSIDNIGKEALENFIGNLLKYKNGDPAK